VRDRRRLCARAARAPSARERARAPAAWRAAQNAQAKRNDPELLRVVTDTRVPTPRQPTRAVKRVAPPSAGPLLPGTRARRGCSRVPLGRAERTGARSDRQGQAGPGHERRQAQRLQRGRLASRILRAGRPLSAASPPRTKRTGRDLAHARALHGTAGGGAGDLNLACNSAMRLPACQHCNGIWTPCCSSAGLAAALEAGGRPTAVIQVVAPQMQSTRRLRSSKGLHEHGQTWPAPTLQMPAAQTEGAASIWRHGSAGRRSQRHSARTGPVINTTRAPGRTSRSTGRGGSARSACGAAQLLNHIGR